MHDDTQATEQAVPDTAADTTSPQPSEASEQVKTAPEATQEQDEVKDQTPTEVEAEDTAEQLLAGKYKSAEDLEKAYKELETKFGQTASEKAELAKVLSEAFVDPSPQVTPEAGVADFDDSGYDDPVNREIDDLKRKSAVQSFILSHNDADAASMQEVLTKDPYVKQIQGHEAKLEYAYLKSQSIAQPKAIAEAQKQAVQATRTKTAEKEIAAVEDARKATPINDKAQLIERMRYGDKAARAEVIGNLPAVQQMRKMAGLE